MIAGVPVMVVTEEGFGERGRPGDGDGRGELVVSGNVAAGEGSR
ncbi:hypothetical protein ACWEPC_32635 [Nonomuraea sp. NPDC004297]